MSVVEINPAEGRSGKVRRVLIRAVRRAATFHGTQLAGFVFIAWDARGEAYTAISTSDGPIGRSMVPTYAADALNRHVAVEIAHGGAANPIEDPPA